MVAYILRSIESPNTPKEKEAGKKSPLYVESYQYTFSDLEKSLFPELNLFEFIKDRYNVPQLLKNLVKVITMLLISRATKREKSDEPRDNQELSMQQKDVLVGYSEKEDQNFVRWKDGAPSASQLS